MKQTLLQTLLIETLDRDERNLILRAFIEKILPPMEREFALIPALGGVKEPFSKKADQSLLVHVLNGLLVAWKLSEYLGEYLDENLSEIEQKLLCLGFTLHDYDKYYFNRGEESPSAHQISEIIQRCRELANKLNFHEFWDEWEQYEIDICFLAQNTQRKRGSNSDPSNWETNEQMLIVDYSQLDRLCDLLAFADVAVHMTDPADVQLTATTNRGKRLKDCLDYLGINEKFNLAYHRLRDCRGLLTNQVHNAFINFACNRNWKPILYFAQGAVYLAPVNSETLNFYDIQQSVWQNILEGDRAQKIEGLKDYFSAGKVGFVRDGKGLKIAPLTREIFTPAQMIRQLPNVIKARVANIKSIATSKRLDKLALSNTERKSLEQGADIWSDRLAEFIILVQKEFFRDNEEYIDWILKALKLNDSISGEITKRQEGGVNYGWYYVAAHYIAHTDLNRHPESEEITEFISNLAEELVVWAEKNNLLPAHNSSTREEFYEYLSQYLEFSNWEPLTSNFSAELTAYTEAKTKNKPICSISSGEFTAEDQLDSVVLFKPQQYSNKNALGGRRIKRGISKIWSLEMILRQAYWNAPAGKLEEQQPIFLYIFPAYVYSPQTARAIGHLVKKLDNVNLRDVCKEWLNADMSYWGLQNLNWSEKEPKAGRYKENYYAKNLPFMAMHCCTTQGKTFADAWVKPAFLTLALPMLLGVKVVATASSDPLYTSDKEFLESALLDNTAGFWNLLGLSNSLRIQHFSGAMERLLTAYCLHLDTQSYRNDERWRSLINTVREVTTNVLNVFTLASEGLRRDKRDRPTPEEVERYWKYAQIWVEIDAEKQDEAEKQGGKYLMEITTKIVQQYREFYQPKLSDSSHTILLPVTKALEVILTVPIGIEDNDLIFQASGQLKDALDRQEVYKRPFLMNRSVDYPTRLAQELTAIHTFMTTCVKELFGELYKGDRALLQENRNRIKSGAEFAYRWLALQEKSTQSES